MNKTFTALIAVAMALSALAVDTSIAYQGVLKNAAGTAAITGAKNITFALYTVATGGTAIWGRTVAVNLDDSGLFNVDLTDSNGSALAGASNANLVNALKVARSGTLYVGLTVEGSAGEIQPRQKILMTPYASWAADATNASGDFSVAGKATVKNAEVTNELIVDGKTTLKGDVAFSQGVTISGKVTVKDTGSFSGYGTIPVGGIIMWSGSSVPAGWALCNGSNGTPDLRNRFIMGGELSSRGQTGGTNSKTLELKNIPAHRHWYTGDDNLGQAHDGDYGSGQWSESVVVGGYDAASSDSGNARVWKTSEQIADQKGQPFDNRPAYYVLAFIMRVK